MNQKPKTFVLAHGFWHGGWCWERVAGPLRAQGHRVFAPSFAGMGDRAHLLSRDITIDTFVQDLIAVIETQELTEVVLVGHSYAGVPISGVADRIPQAIAHLVYLDAVVVEPGASVFSVYPPDDAKARIAAAEEANGGLAIPPPANPPPSWGLAEGGADRAWVMRRLTPHPVGSCTTAMAMRNPVGNGLPRTYVCLTRSSLPAVDNARRLVRSWPGWGWIDLDAPHEAMIVDPDAVVRILAGT